MLIANIIKYTYYRYEYTMALARFEEGVVL